MTAIDTAYADATATAARIVRMSWQAVAFIAFLALCALPLLSGDAVEWVSKGTGAEGALAYAFAWGAAAALGALAVATIAVPTVVVLLLLNRPR